MRGALLFCAALLAITFSGCIGGPASGLFAAWQLPSGSPEPVFVDDCGELLNVLNDRTLEESESRLEQSVKRSYGGGRLVVDAVADMAESADGDDAGGTSGGSAPSARESEVTGTNNQEQGVDEADLLKTDGEWTYVLQGSSLRILHSANVGDLVDYARIDFDDEQGGQLLLERRDPSTPMDDRLVVLTRSWTETFDGSAGDKDDPIHPEPHPHYRQYTRIRVLDLMDRGDPSVVKDMMVEGDNVGARLVDGHAYIVVHARQSDLQLRTYADPRWEDLQDRGMEWEDYHSLSGSQQQNLREEIAEEARAHNQQVVDNASLRDYLPRIRERADETTVLRPLDDAGCKRFMITEEATGRSVSTIVSLHVAGDDVDDEVTQALGSRPIVYGALDAIVLAAASRDSWWFWENPRVDEATDLQWFDLDGLRVEPRASGRIPGIVQDSFGIDVYDDTLRVATTTGQWSRWWIDGDEREPMMNHLVVLESEAGALVPMGMVGGIAPEERIWSARFTDTRAYMITFEQIDPLWIIDLTDPAAPQILGELEIPGVSTYIHPLSDELLLTIGYGAGEEGRGLDWSRVQVSLFDISDESDPQRADLLELSPQEGWSRSGATREHKAFTYWDRLGMLAVPLSTSHYDGNKHDQHVGLKLVKVDEEAKDLSHYGEFDHNSLIEEKENYRYGGSEIQRSYFLGRPDDGIVSVYALSPFGMTAHDLGTLVEQSSVAFEGEPYYWHGME